MSLAKLYLLPFLIYIGVVVYLADALFLDRELEASSETGQVVKPFILSQLRYPNKRFEHTDLVRQTSILNVWASWCPACRQEHPYLMELATSQSIPIYGLDLRDTRKDALRFLAESGNPYIASGFDEKGDVARELGVPGTPTTFLIDRRGVILHKHSSPLTPEVWKRAFLPHISREP